MIHYYNFRQNLPRCWSVLKISCVKGVACLETSVKNLHNQRPLFESIMEGSVGPLAMINYELRQARKGATVVVTSCAGVWLAENSTLFALYLIFFTTIALIDNCLAAFWSLYSNFFLSFPSKLSAIIKRGNTMKTLFILMAVAVLAMGCSTSSTVEYSEMDPLEKKQIG